MFRNIDILNVYHIEQQSSYSIVYNVHESCILIALKSYMKFWVICIAISHDLELHVIHEFCKAVFNKDRCSIISITAYFCMKPCHNILLNYETNSKAQVISNMHLLMLFPCKSLCCTFSIVTVATLGGLVFTLIFTVCHKNLLLIF